MAGGQSGKNSVGGLLTSTLSVLLLRMTVMSGIRHRFAVLSNHPCKMAARNTFDAIVSVINVYLFIVKNCDVTCFDKFCYA